MARKIFDDYEGDLPTVTEEYGLNVETPLEFNLDDYVGGTFRGKDIYDLDQIVDQIDAGRAQKVTANNTITYTFLGEGDGLIGLYNNPTVGLSGGNGLGAFSATQVAAARSSIELWDDLIAPEFRETNGRGADIQFANSSDPGQAFAYYPGEKGYKFYGDVFVADPKLNWTNEWLGFGGYGKTTLIHELGHTIGLSHPGSYNGIGATTYAAQAEYAQDSEQYSIMSYWSPSETGARIINWDLVFFGNAQTPMVHDIYVAQVKYGADMTTRTDDTVYGFNSTADRDVFDFSENAFPNVAIWDAGGEDTLDFSGFFGGTVLDLRDGQFSSGGSAIPNVVSVNQSRVDLFFETGFFAGYTSQASIDITAGNFLNANRASIANDWGYDDVFAVNYQNIAIAYGAEIENGIGSEYRDIIIANELDNTLTGNGGDDVFIFLDGGTDTITDFETGSDLVDLSAFGITDAGVSISAGLLEADLNGDGTADLTLIFSNGAELAATDVFYG